MSKVECWPEWDMETDYNFWADLLTTYRSNPDWLKFCWLFFPAVLLTLAGHGLARLIQTALCNRENASPSPPPPSPPQTFRGWIGEDGVLYLQQQEPPPPKTK